MCYVAPDFLLRNLDLNLVGTRCRVAGLARRREGKGRRKERRREKGRELIKMVEEKEGRWTKGRKTQTKEERENITMKEEESREKRRKIKLEEEIKGRKAQNWRGK